jgi:hypothetical protein
MPNDTVRKRRQSRISDAKPPEAWVDREVADCEFKDERLGKRFRSLLEQLSSSPGDGSPLVCQDWANTAYRFLDNGRDTGVSLYGPEQFIEHLEHKLAASTWNLVEDLSFKFYPTGERLADGDEIIELHIANSGDIMAAAPEIDR